MSDEELFSPFPAVRLAAAEKLDRTQKEQILSS